ncbi:MAG: hypothetical protein A2173_08810 [Planctomycetes bacterium RBG_13_44_8b]|nr:MAG: hypothetical protein A2173_08810 [Planctomycetes bacterium RBG_13_44_8b]
MAEKESTQNAVFVTQTIVIVILLVAWIMSSGLGLLFYLERSASNKLLDKLALIKPGTKLSDVKDKLGGLTIRELEKFDEVLAWSHRIKDEQFCKGKKLYIFSDVVTPTCRGMDVYMDSNDVIVYATWYQE